MEGFKESLEQIEEDIYNHELKLGQVEEDLLSLEDNANNLNQRINLRDGIQYKNLKIEEDKLQNYIKGSKEEYREIEYDLGKEKRACNILLDSILKENKNNTSLVLTTDNEELEEDTKHYLNSYAIPDIVNTFFDYKNNYFYNGVSNTKMKKQKFKDYLFNLMISNVNGFNNRHGNIRGREKKIENFDLLLGNTLAMAHKFKSHSMKEYLSFLTSTNDNVIHISLLNENEVQKYLEDKHITL
jgi:hypothetical protein